MIRINHSTRYQTYLEQICQIRDQHIGGERLIHDRKQDKVTIPQTLLQTIIFGNINSIQGSYMKTKSIPYSQGMSLYSTISWRHIYADTSKYILYLK